MWNKVLLIWLVLLWVLAGCLGTTTSNIVHIYLAIYSNIRTLEYQKHLGCLNSSLFLDISHYGIGFKSGSLFQRNWALEGLSGP